MMDMIEVEKEIARATQQLRAELTAEREKVAQFEDYKAKTGLAYKGSEQETRDKLAAAQATIAYLLGVMDEWLWATVNDRENYADMRKMTQECFKKNTNLDALHEDRARIFANLITRFRPVPGVVAAPVQRSELVKFFAEEAAAHRARKEGK